MTELKLKGYTFAELFQPLKLQQLDNEFLQYLAGRQPEAHESLLAWRHHRRDFTPIEVSSLLLACAPALEQFVAELFGIEQALVISQLTTLSHDPVFIFKKWYVLREARRRLSKIATLQNFTELHAWLRAQLAGREKVDTDLELAVAELGCHYLEQPQHYAVEIALLTDWCAQAMTDPVGQALVQHWVSFHLPARLDIHNLVPLQPVPEDSLSRYEGIPPYRTRDGFELTDSRMSEREVLDQVHYCVYCHEHDGDFCSKGFPEKKNEQPRQIKMNALGEFMTGCPLEEKISEMHTLKKDGHTIAALAMVMVDNPMCPVTGHRICNDCMKACIYQKQEPVNIPQIETRVLSDVLALPWGVEIYDLLTRWNPLRQDQYVAKPYNGLKILVMGMGPAGFTLAHHLLMEGMAVVGVDGLKIEPLPQKYLTEPVYAYEELQENLAERIMRGFGGVAEYGITVRWDKNFLKLIYLSLARRPYFQVYGGVRFGGTITVEDVWALGFHHLAIAVGAGLPQEISIPGSMASGMRQANDFLMALQLTGAAKQSSLANLQVRLPAVVIGGGLTGIDTATEVQAYYIVQVEKILARYETLTKALGEARVREQFDEASFAILSEFLAHGRALRAERALALQEQRQPDLLSYIRQWGGVTVAYRRLLRESPAYKRNHEEVRKAFEEGIYYAEGLEPSAVRLDKFEQVTALVCRARFYDEQGQWILSDAERILPARSIFVATGARPNIAYEYEHRGTFQRDGSEYRTYAAPSVDELIYIPPDGHCKTAVFGAFTSYQKDQYRVTFLGDTHPVFHGSVVRAVASAKRTYPKILTVLNSAVSAVGDPQEYQQFAINIQDAFSATLVDIKRHTPSVVEMKIRAPLAAKNFAPGQFYRVQNYEMLAKKVHGTLLQTEAIALLGAQVDKTSGIISFMVLEKGASSRLIATLKPGKPIALMGPTGVRTKIPQDQETVLIVGGRLSAAQIRSVGLAMRAAGNRVLYVAGFRDAAEVYCQEELEAAADKIIWVTETGDPVAPQRPQDCSATGEFLSVLLRYARGELDHFPGGPEIPLQQVKRVLVVGSHRLVRLMQEATQGVLRDYFPQQLPVLASINGPMQCMLKGVCAQCLVWQLDPTTGKRTKAVFTCSWQDQPLEQVDIDNLVARLSQNHVQEKISNLWLDYLLTHFEIEHV